MSTQSKDDTKRAYSVEGAARAADLGRTSIYEEIWAGRLPAHKAGRRTIILADDLERWLRGLPFYEKGGAEGQSAAG